MDSSRLRWLDAARGIGIILVVYGHVARGINTAGIPFQGFQTLDAFVYSFHMPLFFALSGYFFIKTAQRGPKDYFRSKAFTVLYPYLVWSLIQIVIQFSVSQLINGAVSFNDVLTFYMPRGQFWFLMGLLIINIVNFLLYYFLRLPGIVISSLLSICCLGLPIDLGILNLGLNNLVFFNLGIFIYAWSATEKWFGYRTIWWASILLFIIIEYAVLIETTSPFWLPVFVGIVGTWVIMQTSFKWLAGYKPLTDLGVHSMPIFLMHTIFSAFVRIALQRFLFIENVAVHLIVGTLVGLYCPLLLYKFVLAKRFQFLFSFPRKSN